MFRKLREKWLLYQATKKLAMCLGISKEEARKQLINLMKDWKHKFNKNQ